MNRLQLGNTKIISEELIPFNTDTEKGTNRIYVDDKFIGTLVATGHPMMPIDFEDIDNNSASILLKELINYEAALRSLELDIDIKNNTKDNITTVILGSLDHNFIFKNDLLIEESFDTEALAILVSEAYGNKEFFNEKHMDRYTLELRSLYAESLKNNEPALS